MNNEVLLTLFKNAGKLKKLVRSGWLRSGVDNPESVAEHVFRTAFIAMILSDRLGLDSQKVLKMSLLHDLAEVVVGDITPYDNESKEAKLKSEEIAFYGLLRELSDRDSYLKLWQDYAYQGSLEAKFVKNIDKFEMALQAYEYQKEKPVLDLSEFLLDAEKYIEIPLVLELFNKLSTDMTKLPKQMRL